MLVWIARMLARLPLAWLQAIGALVGRIALSLSSGFRRKSTENLQLAGLLDAGRLRRTAEQTGRGVAETLFIWFAEPARVEALIRIEGQSVLDDARAGGRGVVILTPHIGSFEAAARGVARSGPITVLYKPPRIEAVRHLVETGRKAPDLVPVPASGAGVRGLLRALRRHECIGILPDQVPPPSGGDFAPFFGVPALTMTLFNRLQQKTGRIDFPDRTTVHRDFWYLRYLRHCADDDRHNRSTAQPAARPHCAAHSGHTDCKPPCPRRVLQHARPVPVVAAHCGAHSQRQQKCRARRR
jgi:KDO2-lipid IV(A) lauroyltransferase